MPGNTNKRYPAELRTRAVRMYHETRPDHDGDWPAMVKVAATIPRWWITSSPPCALLPYTSASSWKRPWAWPWSNSWR